MIVRASVFSAVVFLGVHTPPDPDADTHSAADLLHSAADQLHDVTARARFNRTLVADVIAGRCPLPTAARTAAAMNAPNPGFKYACGYDHAGPPDARAAAVLVTWASVELEADRPRRAAVLERLAAEYRAAYGAPLPAAGADH